MGNFWEILYILSWQRAANPPILWRPSYVAYYPFFKLLPTLPLPQLACHLQPPLPLFFLLFCFFSWMCFMPHDNMDLHKSSLGTLVPAGPWCVFYATSHQVDWGLTQHDFLRVLGFDIIHKTYTAHSGASRLAHP